MKWKLKTALLAAACVVAAPAHAVTMIGGFTFDDDAFVDVLLDSAGSYSTSGGTLSDVLTDVDEETFAFSFDADAFLELGFTDNVAVNGAGADIVLFELGNTEDSWNVTINGVTLFVPSVDTGFDTSLGFNLDAAAIDLSDFGVADGATISSLRLTFNDIGTVASTSLVGALNSRSVNGAIPEPATWAFMIFGFGLIGAAMRRRKANVKVSYA